MILIACYLALSLLLSPLLLLSLQLQFDILSLFVVSQKVMIERETFGGERRRGRRGERGGGVLRRGIALDFGKNKSFSMYRKKMTEGTFARKRSVSPNIFSGSETNGSGSDSIHSLRKSRIL